MASQYETVECSHTRADWERILLIVVLTIGFITLLLLMMALLNGAAGEVVTPQRTGTIWLV